MGSPQAHGVSADFNMWLLWLPLVSPFSQNWRKQGTWSIKWKFPRRGLEVLRITFRLFLRGGEVRFREWRTSLCHISTKSFQSRIWCIHSLSLSSSPLCSTKICLITTGLNNTFSSKLFICAMCFDTSPFCLDILDKSMSPLLIPETLENTDGLQLCTSYLLPSHSSSSTKHLMKAFKFKNMSYINLGRFFQNTNKCKLCYRNGGREHLFFFFPVPLTKTVPGMWTALKIIWWIKNKSSMTL